MTLEEAVREGPSNVVVAAYMRAFDENGLHLATLHRRIDGGMPADRAFTEKPWASLSEIRKREWRENHGQRMFFVRMRVDSRQLTFRGREQSLADWAREVGVKATTIGKRLDAGWPVERALATKTLTLKSRWADPEQRARLVSSLHTNPKIRKIRFLGRVQCIAEWARELGFNKATLVNRFRKGWAIRRALTTPTGPTGGNTNSLALKAREAGITPDVVRKRLKHDWALDRALMTPVRKMKLAARHEASHA